MAQPQVTPYGSWQSPITADLIGTEMLRLGQIVSDGEDIYWVEMRPTEEGRNVIVRRTPDGQTTDMTPPPFNVRTRVHEYGGGAFVVEPNGRARARQSIWIWRSWPSVEPGSEIVVPGRVRVAP